MQFSFNLDSRIISLSFSRIFFLESFSRIEFQELEKDEVELKLVNLQIKTSN